MSLLIDGYNVLYAVGIFGRGVGPGTLERGRLALLNFLAESLPPEAVAQTTVVFDAADAPRDLPRTSKHRGLTVRFAVGYENADELLAELIRTDSAPRRLVVVSSDRQVQRAARRRRAKATDAETWWSEVHQQRASRRKPRKNPAERPGPPGEAEVAFWLEEFSNPELPEPPEPAPQREAGEGIRKDAAESNEPPSEKPTDLENPFPPGYGEDLLD